MALEVYRRKRNFRTTPEPAGRVAKHRTKGLAFVIQKHAATRLHYDFRLELNGVLVSWAVPKGPSLDPNDKRLAMHVEDHPIEYGDFEGVIPPKQYGSGTVLLWDRGTWTPKEDPEAGYRKGKLKFALDGEKLHGGWTLVRTHGSKYGNGGKESWLLIKEDDEFAVPSREASVVEEHPNSVASGRSLEEIARDGDRVWHSNKSVAENVKSGAVRKQRAQAHRTAGVRGAVKAALPEFIQPVLATLVDAAPAGDAWLHEMKYDGYRILARIEGGEARLFSRNGKEWTANFPTIARAAARLPVKSAWVDGEVIVMQADGRSSFQALQNALSGANGKDFYYYVFDLPYLDGYDLRQAPLLERKRVLHTLIASKEGPLRLSEHIVGSGAEYFNESCRLKLEGIISKRADSTYQAGRGRAWVKVKCELRQEVVIGGYTDPEGSRTAFGALLLGVYEEKGQLRYCGKVGTGFNDATLKALKKKLDALVQKDPPFINPPKGAEARRAHWVKPELVAEVRFTEWTNDGTLRHPSFQGLREDKKASEVVRERPAPASNVVPDATPAKRRAKRQAPDGAASKTRGDEVAGVPLTNAAKVLYPEAKITKRDLALYYQSVCDWILPHLENRPLTLVRCPNGWDKQCFYQKNAADNVSEAIERVMVRTSEGPGRYMMANSLSALVSLVQMGVLEMHPWGSTHRRLECPDRIIFDFDPDDDLNWNEIVEAVRLMKTLLEEIGLEGFLKTTGGKGLHVVLPIQPTMPWDQIKGFSKSIAELLCRTFPDRFTDKISKSRRRGKIFIDYLRNAEGATAIAAYAVRARKNAPVATPIAWDELGREVRFDHFHVHNVPARLKRLKSDPWERFFKIRQAVTKPLMKKVGYS
ncbi:MAG TPA: DNA ligase D [Burkholderiales bacterium]|nr:DNA ligase D [Burkholderiales bacterium]